jgi:VIT1/CCC1 family predicted Fe2+/Mn2+ transporter
MKDSLRQGISFGLTSGTITTLGLMVGLHSGTHSRIVVIGGILTIAIADAFSDALGIHISVESENERSPSEIWVATVATFFSKFLFALTFIIPILIFKLSIAIIISLIWGMSILALLSYFIARVRNENPTKIIIEHLLIVCAVVITTHFLGNWISSSMT